MTVEEVNKAIDALKANGMTEQEILASFYAMFCEDKITADQLEGLAQVMGYELTDEFKNLSDEDKKLFGDDVEEDPDAADDKPAEGVSEEEVEDAKQYGEDGETPKPEEEEKKEEPKEEPKEEEKEENPEPESEEDEENRAKKLFGLK